MPYARRFVHYSPTPADLVGPIDGCRVPAGAWFELHRQGGCGEGEIVLLEADSSGGEVATGDWIAFEYDTGDRWYLGQVKDRRSIGAGAERLSLAGMGRQLDEVFPGGFGRGVADGMPPHRYAQTDAFPFDPDRSDETLDAASDPAEVVRMLVQQYVEPLTDVVYDAGLVEDPANAAAVFSLKFRGEESAAAALRDLALRGGRFSWGVNAEGKFFFLKPKTTLLATFQEGVDVVSLESLFRRDLIFNRLLLTGGYVYGDPLDVSDSAVKLYRWRGHYLQPASRSAYGDRHIAVAIPWVRSPDDSRGFAREFLRTYAQPAWSYRIEVGGQSSLPLPWNGRVRLKDASGAELFTGPVETLRVQFDHTPRFAMQLGPLDPRLFWPPPRQPERWPIGVPGGEEISFSSSTGGSSSGFPSSDTGGTASF